MLAQRFMALFDGLNRAYGEFTIAGAKGPKATGKALTKKGPVTPDLWNRHLEGKVGLGCLPLRDDGTVRFAAIDIDSYTGFDINAFAAAVKSKGYPGVVCRSKSGGAHLYFFFAQPVPAVYVRGRMKLIATALGYPKAELFPKQDKLLSKEETGNWINMPYFGGADSTRYAVVDGRALSPEAFLNHAEETLLAAEDMEKGEPISSEFQDAPPCIETLTMTGFPPGTLNNALFNMGVYARMKFPDDWQKKVYEYNERFMGPGTQLEVQQLIKSLDKKKYTYKCNEAPICGVCDKLQCSRRQFSPAGEYSPYKSPQAQKATRPSILSEVEPPVQCYQPPDESADEPYWVFKIHGVEMDVSVDMVQEQKKFLRGYLKTFHRVVLAVDETRWAKEMNALLSEADVFQMAPDAGPEGQFLTHLEAFCTGRSQARVQEELLLGRPWADGERVYFRSQDLLRYLDVNRCKDFTERQLYAILRRRGARHHKFTLKGKCVSCWSVGRFDEQEGEIAGPGIPG